MLLDCFQSYSLNSKLLVHHYTGAQGDQRPWSPCPAFWTASLWKIDKPSIFKPHFGLIILCKYVQHFYKINSIFSLNMFNICLSKCWNYKDEILYEMLKILKLSLARGGMGWEGPAAVQAQWRREPAWGGSRGMGGRREWERVRVGVRVWVCWSNSCRWLHGSQTLEGRDKKTFRKIYRIAPLPPTHTRTN